MTFIRTKEEREAHSLADLDRDEAAQERALFDRVRYYAIMRFWFHDTQWQHA